MRMTMNTLDLEMRSKELFNNSEATESQNAHNAQSWVKAVSFLADRWLLATQVQRKDAK